jgi:hypothetical protein
LKAKTEIKNVFGRLNKSFLGVYKNINSILTAHEGKTRTSISRIAFQRPESKILLENFGYVI